MNEDVMEYRAMSSPRNEARPGELSLTVHHCIARNAPLIIGSILLMGISFAGLMVGSLHAQAYPDRPIRFILPMAPGGGADIQGRIIGQKLAERLGQPVVVENRPGAGGNIGIESVGKARPDGYTIILTTPAIAISPSLDKKLNYNPIKDFAPISLTAQVPVIVLVQPSSKISNLKELVAFARANPGKLNYGSTGIGGSAHLAGELLKSLLKIDIVHVAFKSAAPAITGLLGGEVEIVLNTATAAMSHIQSGRAKAIAVLSEERLSSLPNVPTAKEAGVDNWVVTVWYGMLAPAGTPPEAINRLNTEWTKIAAMPETVEQLRKVGFETMSSTPEQFTHFLRAEIDRWDKVIKEANLKINY